MHKNSLICFLFSFPSLGIPKLFTPEEIANYYLSLYLRDRIQIDLASMESDVSRFLKQTIHGGKQTEFAGIDFGEGGGAFCLSEKGKKSYDAWQTLPEGLVATVPVSTAHQNKTSTGDRAPMGIGNG